MPSLTVTFVARGRARLMHAVYDARSDTLIPEGFVFDGLSVPPWAWPLVGHPFSGSSLYAALVHDFHCARREHPCRVVHRWLYAHLRADGVGRFRAGLMYAAVLLAGPRW